MSEVKKDEFWDLGEVDVIHPSKPSLYKIMNAIILCRGKVHDTFSMEADKCEWKYPAISSCVLFRISLPHGMKEKFEEISGFKLSDPPKVHLN